MKLYTVYSFTDIHSLKIVYIGCTSDLYLRRKGHLCYKKKITNKPFYDYLMQCKELNQRPIIKVISEGLDYKNACDIERMLIQKLKPEFNIAYNLSNHISRNTLDNRKENLQNGKNRRIERKKRESKSLFTGVYKAGKRYKSQIMINKVQYYLGVYNTPEEAREIYIKSQPIQ